MDAALSAHAATPGYDPSRGNRRAQSSSLRFLGGAAKCWPARHPAATANTTMTKMMIPMIPRSDIASSNADGTLADAGE